jgi:TrmH family RNA methyltransferase
LVTDNVFNAISPTDHPTGILAVISWHNPAFVLPTQSCVVLETVQDSGNLGTILRTAAAAGIQHILLSDGCAQAWSPRVLRAAMGAHFSLNIYEKIDLLSVLPAYQGQLLATGLTQAKSLYSLNLNQSTAWLFGSEGQGLSEQVMRLAKQQVIIPMSTGVESLNVAAAVAVCLFEQRRQQMRNT